MVEDEQPDPVEIVRALLRVIEQNAAFPYGKTDEDDKAIAAAEAFVADAPDKSWWS